MEQKKLYLDKEHSKISGVCAGLGNFLGIDATVIRLVWVLVSFFAGCFIIGGLVYLLCACVIEPAPPKQTAYYYDPNANYQGSGSQQL